MTLEEELRRGHEANAIINNPLFRECVDKLKKDVIDTWAACPARDTEGREWLWNHYQAALKFEENLISLMNTGKMAAQMQREKSLKDRIMSVIK